VIEMTEMRTEDVEALAGALENAYGNGHLDGRSNRHANNNWKEIAAEYLKMVGYGETAPIPMHIYCAKCGAQHIDDGEFATKVHHTHACQQCGHVWRPAVVATVGVRFLPGFKNGGSR
jgi:hypothetical protein